MVKSNMKLCFFLYKINKIIQRKLVAKWVHSRISQEFKILLLHNFFKTDYLVSG